MLYTIQNCYDSCRAHKQSFAYQKVVDSVGHVFYDQELPLHLQVEKEKEYEKESYPGQLLPPKFVEFKPLRTKQGLLYLKLEKRACITPKPSGNKELKEVLIFHIKLERESEYQNPIKVQDIEYYITKIGSQLFLGIEKARKHNASIKEKCKICHVKDWPWVDSFT